MVKKKVTVEDVLENAPIVNPDGTEYKETCLEKIDNWLWKYIPGYPFLSRIWRIHLCPHALKYKIKQIYQRIAWGFDDTETWDLDTQFYKWLYPRLKRFTEITKAYPVSYHNPQQWRDELTKRVEQLGYLVKYDELDFDDWSYIPKKELEDLKKKSPNDKWGINMTAFHHMEQDFNEWFGKNVNQLWW